MKIALLGANGFIGRNVEELLAGKGYSVFPVARHYGFDLRELSENVRFIEESQCEVIINCAAYVGSLNYVTEFAADIITYNSKMILNLYEAVQKSNPSIVLIQPIANCAYPASSVTYKETELHNGPLHFSVMSYGATRRFLLAVSDCYRSQYGIRSVNLITPNMYGPYDSVDPNKAHALNALVSKFVKAINSCQDLVEIWGTGKAVREWLYAPDFARIIVEVLDNMEDRKYDEPMNIAQEHGLSVKELVDLILKNIDYKGTVWYNSSMPDGAPRKVMNKERFEMIFPRFLFSSFEEGIERTAAYYQSIYPY